MIKLEEVNKEMTDIIYQRDLMCGGKRKLLKEEKQELGRMGKRYNLLKSCKYYLETSPTKEFLKKEVYRLENRIDLLDANFSLMPIANDPLIQSHVLKEKKKEYEKSNDYGHLRNQLRTLRYLLK